MHTDSSARGACLAAVQQARMDAQGDRGGHGIDRVRFLAPEPNLDDALLVLHEQTDGFSTQVPHFRKFADSIVPLECCVLESRQFADLPRSRVSPKFMGRETTM